MKGGQQKDRQKNEQNMTLPYIITAITTMLELGFFSTTVEISRVTRHAYHNSSPQFQNVIPQQREKAAANKTCLESKII